MKVNIPARIAKGGPVVLVCKDDGGLTGGPRVHVALYFEDRESAVKYNKRLILGKNPSTEIFPVEII